MSVVKKEYLDGRIVAYCGDCLDVMPTLEKVDLVLTDPPYGDGFGYGRYKKQILNNETPDINFEFIKSVDNLVKKDKSIYIFSNWKYEIDIRNFVNDEIDWNIRHKVVINKNNIGMGYGFRNKYEELLVFEKGKARYNSNDFANVLDMAHIHHDKNTHPHQKCDQMFIKLLRHSSKPNDIVLDAFGGSGTTAIACIKENRRCIIIEKDPEYFDIIFQRIEQAIIEKRSQLL